MEIDKLIKGKIVIKDSKTGEKVVDTHNLVLENGREAFFDFFIRLLIGREDLTMQDAYIEIDSKNVLDANNTKVTDIFFGTNTVATTSDYILPSTNTYEKKSISKENTSVILRYGKEIIDGEKSSFYLSISCKINTNTYSLGTLAEAGLMFEDTSLFSRASFGPLEVSGDSEFDFEYFIYI